jgi:vacuolar-type H+-ATPase subunit I/STV1
MVGAYPIAEAYRKETRETFADDTADKEAKTRTSIIRIFISVGLMALAIVLGFIFLWAYRKEKTLMVVVLSVVVFIYSLLIMVFVLVQRANLDYVYFNLFMGSSAFMVIMMILLIIIFSIIASRRLNTERSGTSGDYYSNRPAPAFSPSPPMTPADYDASGSNPY